MRGLVLRLGVSKVGGILRKNRLHAGVFSLVELSRRYLNRSDMVKSIQNVLKRIKDSDQTITPGVVSTGRGGRDVRAVRDRLGENGVQSLIASRRAGATMRQLVERYGISESSVKRVLKGVRKR